MGRPNVATRTARPDSIASILDRTRSPLRLTHRVRYKIFFSVDGQDINGKAIAGVNEPGALRMLVVHQPVFILSVSRKRTKSARPT